MPAFIRFAGVVLLLALAAPAVAQRVSQAERIAALEQRVAGSQSNADLLNQIAQLRGEMQALRAQIEELQQSRDAAAATARTQALDVDSRLGRLEGAPAFNGPVGASGNSASAVAAASKPSATPRRLNAEANRRPDASARAQTATREPDADAQAGYSGTSAEDSADGSATPAGAELAAYATAFDALKSARYVEASSLFAAYIDRYPGSVYAPNALYWLGESYYATRAYARALEPFRQVVDRFPTHDKAAGAWLKIGLAELSLQHLPQARAAFVEVVSRYPGSDAARSAADRLQALQTPR